MRVSELNWMQVRDYLKEDDRCVLPLGSTEQHAFLSLATDSVLAERIAVEAAAPLGIPVFPVLSYGLTPYFMAFPGTVTLTEKTYGAVLTEVLDGLASHGFRRILIVNGHGGNRPARPMVEAWVDRAGSGRDHAAHGLRIVWHDWWRAPAVHAAVAEVDPDASHASWMESFPWTRVGGVDEPEAHKQPVDMSGRDRISPEEVRSLLGDGSFGGDYRQPAEVEARIWDIGVRETRDLLEKGWR